MVLWGTPNLYDRTTQAAKWCTKFLLTSSYVHAPRGMTFACIPEPQYLLLRLEIYIRLRLVMPSMQHNVSVINTPPRLLSGGNEKMLNSKAMASLHHPT